MPFLVRESARDDFLVCVAHNRSSALWLAEHKQLPYIVQPRANTPDSRLFVERAIDFRPDIVISMSYGLRIPEVVLDASRLGGINFHGGLLPEWRGANIVNWVLIEGAQQSGVTAHWMTPHFDDGPIVARETIEVTDTETARSLARKLFDLSCQMYQRVVSELRSGRTLPAVPQEHVNSRYYKRRKPEDGRIDWAQSDREIYNLIRALVHPWPGAFCIQRDGTKIVFDDFVPLSLISDLRKQFG
jgi:methionyl-tRNA formyltransferase